MSGARSVYNLPFMQYRPPMEKMAWNIESEYPSYNSPEYTADFKLVENKISQMETWIADLITPLEQASASNSDPASAHVELL